jgi:hypothetical protein
MKKAPEGAPHNTNCPHSEAKKPLNRENTCPRWDSNQPPPLKIRLFPENIPIRPSPPPRPTRSEAQGVHNVHTLFLTSLMQRPETWLSPSGGESCVLAFIPPESPHARARPGDRLTPRLEHRRTSQVANCEKRAPWRYASFEHLMGERMK